MSEASGPLTGLQAEMLRQILSKGNEQVHDALETTLGPAFSKLEIHTAMQRLKELPARLGQAPLVTVRIPIDGDLKGEFLYLQDETDFQMLKQALAAKVAGPVHTVNEATDYLIPNWLEDHHGGESPGELDVKVREAVNEMSDRLFGAYLTTIYTRCHMATFLELPQATIPDARQSVLKAALEKYTKVAERAFLVDATCTAGEEPFRFYLVMFAEPEGLRAMLGTLAKPH
jgi:chemotaxis protein CheY-P-specific phosphatase CheC